MKKYLFTMSAVAMLFATSCQNDLDMPQGAGETATVAFNISTPEIATRAYSDGQTATNLQYAVYDAAGNHLDELDGTATMENLRTTIDIKLTTGNTYNVIFWAAAPNAPYTFDSATKKVTVDYKNVTCNNEAYDAFYTLSTFQVKGAQTENVVLTRPFAQINIGTNDYEDSRKAGYVPTQSTVTVSDIYNVLNLWNGEVTGETSVTFKADAIDRNQDFPVPGYEYIAMNYVLVPKNKKTVEVTFGYGDDSYKTRTVGSVPVQRNFRTNIYGQLLTSDVDINVTIDPIYEGENPVDGKYTYFVVDTDEELKAALTSNHEHIYVELTGDVTYDVAAWDTYAMGGDKTNSITINGEKVITRGTAPTRILTFNQTNSDWNNIATKNGAKLILKNLNVTNEGHNNGPWNRHDLNFACDVEMENVISDKAIALKAGGVLNGVTINDNNTSDTYALWIQPNGQAVTLNGCTINMPAEDAGRGIKIDEQYVDEVKAPTLNVSGTTFITKEKAAVLVKSVDGAIINWGKGNNIEKVAADQAFAVWVDEDAAAYADKVIVNGAYKTIEGKSAVAESDADITKAINEGKTSILLANGNYAMPAITDKNVTILGSRDVVITINKPAMHGSDITLQGVTVKASGTYTGIQHVNTVTYNNVKVIGEMCLYGEKVAFNNCEFELNNQYIWTYGAKNAEFNGCEFNTNGKAILVYNEGSGATNVVVKGCEFNATAGAKAGAIANQNCAAIEIDNFQNSGKGVAHKVTATNNTVGANFSGEWRIKNYVAPNPINVNGVDYTQIALDGKLMTIDANKNVTVVE